MVEHQQQGRHPWQFPYAMDCTVMLCSFNASHQFLKPVTSKAFNLHLCSIARKNHLFLLQVRIYQLPLRSYDLVSTNTWKQMYLTKFVVYAMATNTYKWPHSNCFVSHMKQPRPSMLHSPHSLVNGAMGHGAHVLLGGSTMVRFLVGSEPECVLLWLGLLIYACCGCVFVGEVTQAKMMGLVSQLWCLCRFMPLILCM